MYTVVCIAIIGICVSIYIEYNKTSTEQLSTRTINIKSNDNNNSVVHTDKIIVDKADNDSIIQLLIKILLSEFRLLGLKLPLIVWITLAINMLQHFTVNAYIVIKYKKYYALITSAVSHKHIIHFLFNVSSLINLSQVLLHRSIQYSNKPVLTSIEYIIIYLPASIASSVIGQFIKYITTNHELYSISLHNVYSLGASMYLSVTVSKY